MLLSRVANYLFWMGRYLERAEHSSRFIHAQYLSSLDSPFEDSRRVMLNSIVQMFGIGNNAGDFSSENSIISMAMLNKDNVGSVNHSFKSVRQNALNARNVLSKELWEVINRFYHYLNNYQPEADETGQLFNFMRKITEHCALIKNLINSTLLHDEAWSVIRLGIHLERSIQTNRILISSLSDISAENNNKNRQLNYYILKTLLSCLEAEEVYKKLYKGVPKPIKVVHFFVTNSIFPRSINYNVNKSKKLINRLFGGNEQMIFQSNTPAFEINKLADSLKYIGIPDLQKKYLSFLEQNMQKLETVSNQIESDYLQLR